MGYMIAGFLTAIVIVPEMFWNKWRDEATRE